LEDLEEAEEDVALDSDPLEEASSDEDSEDEDSDPDPVFDSDSDSSSESLLSWDSSSLASFDLVGVLAVFISIFLSLSFLLGELRRPFLRRDKTMAIITTKMITTPTGTTTAMIIVFLSEEEDEEEEDPCGLPEVEEPEVAGIDTVVAALTTILSSWDETEETVYPSTADPLEESNETI